MRFWAACTVALYHLAFWSWAMPTNLPFMVSGGRVRFESLAPFTWFGWCGVETFFVLSGVVICISAEHATAYQFLRGRISRLYPAVGICATLTALVLLVLDVAPQAHILADYGRSLLIFCKGPWVDTVYRTLIPEGLFYALVWSLLMCGWFHRTERIAVGLGAYSLAFWALGTVLPPLAAPGVIAYFSKDALFFALGMMVFVMARKGVSTVRIAAIAVLALCGALEVGLVATEIGNALPAANALVVRSQAIVAPLVWLASLAAIIASVLLNDTLTTRVGTLAPIIQVMGLMTYPLYLIHDVVGSAVLRTSPIWGQRVALGAALVVSFVGAYIVVLLEPSLRRPLIRLVDRVAASLQDAKRKLRGLRDRALWPEPSVAIGSRHAGSVRRPPPTP